MNDESNLKKNSDTNLNDEEEYALFLETRAEQIRRAAKRKDILEWGRLLFPEKFYLPFCYELHNYFIEIRWRGFTSTEAPRGHAKTLIKCFLIPIFQALEESKVHQGEIPRFRHYLNVQATQDKALDVNRSIKLEFEENVLLRHVYGNCIGKRWTDQQFVLKNGVIFSAISAGQSIRGINYRNIRPDYVLVDDLYNEDDINNPESTEKKNAWFWGALYPARAKSRLNSVHVQGTAINNYDLMMALKKDATIMSRTFKAVKDEIAKTVLWIELNTYDSLMVDKTRMGSHIWYREMQNERRDEATAIVKNSWLDGWEMDKNEFKFDHTCGIVGVILGIDPSIGEKVENDYTGGARVWKVRWKDGAEIFFIDQLVNDHFSLDKRVGMVRDLAEDQMRAMAAHPVSSVRIEGIGGFKDFANTVAAKTSLPVSVVDKVPDKISNLENKSHFFENRKVKINKNIDKTLIDMLRYQLTTNHPKHDDLRDAVLLTLDDQGGLWKFV